MQLLYNVLGVRSYLDERDLGGGDQGLLLATIIASNLFLFLDWKVDGEG